MNGKFVGLFRLLEKAYQPNRQLANVHYIRQIVLPSGRVIGKRMVYILPIKAFMITFVIRKIFLGFTCISLMMEK